MSIFARADFWVASAERALKTAAQTAIATIGTDAVGVTELDWAGIGGVVATATILSILFSIASGGVSQDGPGIGPEVVARRAIVEQVNSEHGRRRDLDGVPDGRDTPGARDVPVSALRDGVAVPHGPRHLRTRGHRSRPGSPPTVTPGIRSRHGIRTHHHRSRDGCSRGGSHCRHRSAARCWRRPSYRSDSHSHSHVQPIVKPKAPPLSYGRVGALSSSGDTKTAPPMKEPLSRGWSGTTGRGMEIPYTESQRPRQGQDRTVTDAPKPGPFKQRLTVYVDGFNLYHGLHDWTGRRLLWLDLLELAQSLRPKQRLTGVKYFTAPVLDDPHAQSRQAHYIEGLTRLHPGVEVVHGRYERKPMECRGCGATWTSYEEKETDVNIATRIVADAYAGSSDSIIIVSGDSDLAAAVRVARKANPRLFVAAAFPPERFSRELQDLMPSTFHIGRSKITQAQLPDTFDVGGKTFQRPSKWR